MFDENTELSSYTTFGVKAKAKWFVRFSSVKELRDKLMLFKDKDLLVLGGGSNVLFLNDFEGVVLKNEILGITLEEEFAEHVLIRAGAGENWHEFVQYCIKKDWGGIENLSLIPGSVGASPMQNIGAYGVEIKDVFYSLQALHIETGELVTFFQSDCQFGYRESVFKRDLKGQYIITSVTYKLSKQPHKINIDYGIIRDKLVEMNVEKPAISDVSNAVIAIRQSKLPDPKVLGNAGSFFKNPTVTSKHLVALQAQYPSIPYYELGGDLVKIPAGWLIESAGWKGYTEGEKGVHKNQALVIVNYGQATGKEIFDLSERILNDIKVKFGIPLEREVNMIG